MSDMSLNRVKYHKYRYSISQLIELSAAACLSFDLSKFTYEAARAGVVPPLGDCAMSSRKSSASCAKSNTFETTSSADIVLYQGNTILRPERQPKLPPPAERQKDEGFAKFLKKHSSPTHNRVTAGGRIVPMEPRSPPPFSLPVNVTNRLQSITSDQHAQDTKEHSNGEWNGFSQNGWMSKHTNTHAPNQGIANAASRQLTGLGDTPTHLLQRSASHNHYEDHWAVSGGQEPMSFPAPNQVYFTGQHIGGPSMQQGVPPPQYTMGPYQSGNLMQLSMGVPLADQYNSAATWPMYNQPLGHQYSTQQVMSTQQLLVACEQHYADLDQQLKNIDRHRAMQNLDPYLAEQRRVIVQQRSDAKDIVEEYQAMLGIKRQIDSSQESFATGFNIDAPAYIPTGKFSILNSLAHKPSLDFAPSEPFIGKRRGAGQRHAIPIRPPPESVADANVKTQNNAVERAASEADEIDEWGDQKGPAPPDVQRAQSELSDMLVAEQQRLLSHRKMPLPHASSRIHSDQACDGVRCTEPHGNAVADESVSVRVTRILPANDTAPHDLDEECKQVMVAIAQPKGTITQVRLIDNRVIDVEGQDLNIVSAPLPTDQWSRSSWSRSGPARLKSQVAQSQNSLRSTSSIGQAAANPISDKENLSVTARGHQKAATDAFLAQFNDVDINVALAMRNETQSLHTASNGRANYDQPTLSEYCTQESFQPAKTQLFTGTDTSFAVMPAVGGIHPGGEYNNLLSPDTLDHKGYSSVSIQNVHAVGSLPNSFDGAVEIRQSIQAHLTATDKAKSPPRLLRRHGNKGSVWHGPFSRDVVERARKQGNATGQAKSYFH